MVRLLLSTLALLLSSSSSNATQVSSEASLEVYEGLLDHFEQWVEKFHKVYDSVEEKLKRRGIWLENHFIIEGHNALPSHTYKLGHNQYSDMTHDEFLKLHRLGQYSHGVVSPKDFIQGGGNDMEGTAVQRRRLGSSSSSSDVVLEEEEPVLEDMPHVLDVPDAVNWVDEGAVTPIKNQGQCGSCWAFSAVGAIEGAFFLKSGELVSFSEQQVVDCDIGGQDLGCNGGLMDNAFAFEENEKGLCTESDYPYQGVQNDCMDSTCKDVEGSEISGFVDVPPSSNDEMVKALAIQPVAIAIEADQLAFQFYRSGVFNSDCGTELDHGVLAVGYGTDEDGGDYYMVKNSWGEMWGDGGYIKLARDMTQTVDDGKCGLLMQPSRPIFN